MALFTCPKFDATFVARRVSIACMLACCTFGFCDEAAEPQPTILPPIKLAAFSSLVGDTEEKPLTPAATDFVKGMALVLLPETYSDDDDWNSTKRIQSGLNVDVDGFKVKTSRRWKNVNHGTWQRVDASLVNPKDHFDLAISLLPKKDAAVPRYRVRAKLRLRATGRQQQWSFGAKLYSLSAEFVADVGLTADLHFKNELVKSDGDSKLRVVPHIENAQARLENFSLRRVSHAKGGAVREFGKVVESIVKRVIKKKNQKLTAKINGKITKKPERFEIPAGVLAIFGATPQAE